MNNIPSSYYAKKLYLAREVITDWVNNRINATQGMMAMHVITNVVSPTPELIEWAKNLDFNEPNASSFFKYQKKPMPTADDFFNERKTYDTGRD